MPGQMRGAGAPQGLSWSWELDFDALMDSLSEPGPHGVGNSVAALSGAGRSSASAGPASTGTASARATSPGRQSEDLEDEAAQRAVPGDLDDGAEPGGQRIPAWALAGRVAERLAPGPDLAAWLAMAPAASLPGGDLAAVAGSWRRVAAWAQARELAAVAQIASRAAARDEKIGTGPDGRPARIPVSAAAEVALELTMSQYGAAGWADLAVALTWRLAGTGAALEAGVIDLYRARLIAEATSMLSDAAARAVEERVLPAAGGQTPGMLRAALRRAVIAADPQGAEERRKEAERQAKVSLYPDQENTATLAGQRLPAIHAAAAMARIKAMARAMKASGAGGVMDLLCAQIYLGLLLGTLPLIPPAEDAPPCDGPSDESGEDPSGGPGENPPGPSGDPPGGPGENPPGPGGDPPGGPGGNDDVPAPGDQDAPRDDDDACPDDGPGGSGWAGPSQDDDDDGRPAGDWPALPGLPVIPPAFTRAKDGRPPAGLLDVSLPWQVLAGASPGPGHLGRIGPITAGQARRLAGCAARDPAAEWRIIVTTSDGQAIAVTRIPRPRDGPPQPAGRTRPDAGMGLVSRVTLTIPEDLVTRPPPLPAPGQSPGPDPPGGILHLALRAAGRAAAQARAAAAADAAAGGCAHASVSPGYRPPPRLKEYVTARDLTCRSPVCRQPAWRGDLDHTIPYDEGGLTCRCNLGAVCRTHHILKQHPDWKLQQTAPGIFTWTTPSGRVFTVTPDTHPV
ncbi:MAG TPA: DUF222 domain-containing protein [Streptosporangiaceae bacterium]|nr:DUF222 domain-containing protein [Streptosporangiaceae bacterium]